jgi:hypothetical protein
LVHKTTKDRTKWTKREWDAIILFEICRSKDNNRLNKEVEIKIDLWY